MCPWENFCQAKLQFCEAVLCSWIRQPGNTYSSLAYIAVGMGLCVYGKKIESICPTLFGVTSIVLGIGSSIFHATGTCLGGELDYLGMFLVTGLLTGLNFQRLFGITWGVTVVVILFTTVALHGLACLLPQTARLIFAFGSPCCVLELILWIRKTYPTRYKQYWLSWGIMIVAVGFWFLDQNSFFCNTEYYWVNGHVIWHLLTAISVIPLTLFYLQFPSLQAKR